MKFLSLDGLTRFKEKLIASAIPYTNTSSELEATNVQAAIDEIAEKKYEVFEYPAGSVDYTVGWVYIPIGKSIELDKVKNTMVNFRDDADGKLWMLPVTAVYDNEESYISVEKISSDHFYLYMNVPSSHLPWWKTCDMCFVVEYY